LIAPLIGAWPITWVLAMLGVASVLALGCILCLRPRSAA
jgi:hypothetical protein